MTADRDNTPHDLFASRPLPAASIIICAFNASATIGRAIQSALDEPEVGQIIVVDDGSTDDTYLVAEKLGADNERLNIFRLNENRGPSFARNLALSHCRCEWIGVLDADDFFLPGRIAGLLHFAGTADMIADDMWKVSEESPEGPRHLLLGDINASRTVSFDEFVFSNIPQKNRDRKELGFIKPLMKLSFLQKHRISYREHMRLGEDYELYVRCLAYGARLLLVPPQGYVSVVRSTSLSGQHTEQDLAHLRDCDEDLAKIPSLTDKNRKILRKHYLSTECKLQWRLLINAIKERDVLAMCKTFFKPLPIPFYLIDKLWEQFRLRVLTG